jgi:hypothetical protein
VHLRSRAPTLFRDSSIMDPCRENDGRDENRTMIAETGRGRSMAEKKEWSVRLGNRRQRVEETPTILEDGCGVFWSQENDLPFFR